MLKILAITILLNCFVFFAQAQTPQEIGSKTAKDGFKNEDAVRDKFNAWQTDDDAKKWLEIMGYKISQISSVNTDKPRGYKADVEVKITLKAKTETNPPVFKEGISIKLVSSLNGFNQIDKRWLATYVKMWEIPPNVAEALKKFVGETLPNKPSREPNRMFLDELGKATQAEVIEFFTQNKARIISDLLKGNGEFFASQLFVAQKESVINRWKLVKIDDAIKFFGEGKVELTARGSLRIGRITMQRKGGDGGRETAKQLQFKLNPAALFDVK
jgi:hypothetical protein